MSVRKVIPGTTAVATLIAAYAVIPRQADLRSLDPPEMVRLETVMGKASVAR